MEIKPYTINNKPVTNVAAVRALHDLINGIKDSTDPEKIRLYAKVTNNGDQQLIDWIEQIASIQDDQEAQRMIERTLIPIDN